MIPSAYGDQQLFPSAHHHDSKSYLKISSVNQFYCTLVNEINQELIGSNSTRKARAVLVFFKDLKKLMDFLHSNEFTTQPYSSNYNVITEDTNAEDRDRKIKMASISGTVTLMTRSLGRGTDFRCLDKDLNDTGGLHVITTFVSDEYSEEIQLRGRTGT